jgi:hypothetical protein
MINYVAVKPGRYNGRDYKPGDVIPSNGIPLNVLNANVSQGRIIPSPPQPVPQIKNKA